MGIGDVVGNGIEFADALLPARDAQGKVTSQHWGRIALTFDSCSTGGMRWDGPAGWGSMEVPLQRLSALEGLGCLPIGYGTRVIPPQQASGAWYDPLTTGNGFLVEQSDPNNLQVIYFQLNTDGTQTWAIGSATAQADGGYFAHLIAPSGTQFGAAFDKTKILKPDTYLLNMRFGCASGSASLLPSMGFGPARSFALQRLTTPVGVPACSP